MSQYFTLDWVKQKGELKNKANKERQDKLVFGVYEFLAHFHLIITYLFMNTYRDTSLDVYRLGWQEKMAGQAKFLGICNCHKEED